MSDYEEVYRREVTAAENFQSGVDINKKMVEELPSKLSALVLVAVADMKACVAKGLVINMSSWASTDHTLTDTPDPLVRLRRPICSVCMAGAVMVNSFNLSLIEIEYAGSLGFARKMHALNSFRRGKIFQAIELLGVSIAELPLSARTVMADLSNSWYYSVELTPEQVTEACEVFTTAAHQLESVGL